MSKLDFIREKTDQTGSPPNIKEESETTAKIISLEYPVSSDFKNKDGSQKLQVKFNLELDGGYLFPCWISYYTEPVSLSNIAKICQTLADKTGAKPHTVNEALQLLKEHGRIYVKCTGYRTWNDQDYPKFGVVTEKLPDAQKTKPLNLIDSMQMVRFKQSQPKISHENESYGPFQCEDVANLPKTLADNLIMLNLCTPLTPEDELIRI